MLLYAQTKSQSNPLIPYDPKLKHTLREVRAIDDNLNP